MSAAESMERWEIEHHLMADREPSRIQLMRAVARLGFNLYFKPIHGTDWSVFASDHVTWHKAAALRFDFLSYDGLAQPMRVALDLGHPLAFYRLFHGQDVPAHTFLTYPETTLTEETWPRFFMTAYQREQNMRPWPAGLHSSMRQTGADAATAEIVHADLVQKRTEPYSEIDINDMMVGALTHIVGRRRELRLGWTPQTATDVVTLGTEYRHCRPCLDIAGMPAEQLDTMRANLISKGYVADPSGT